MTLATANLFKAKWTDDIHDEWTRSLLASRPDITAEKLQRIRALMDIAVPDSLVPRSKYKTLIRSLRLPDPNDRHVLAAAIACGAELIITFNIKDFPKSTLSKYNMAAALPDDFITSLLDQDEHRVQKCIYLQQSRLKNPPMSFGEILATLEASGLRKAVNRLRKLTRCI